MKVFNDLRTRGVGDILIAVTDGLRGLVVLAARGVLDLAAVLDTIEDNALGRTAAVKDIMTALERYKPIRAEGWPRSPKGMGDALRRAAPALRQTGIECTPLGKGSGGVVRWSIKKKAARSKSQTSQVTPSAAPENTGLGSSVTLNEGGTLRVMTIVNQELLKFGR
jgi:hypothetical protein